MKKKLTDDELYAFTGIVEADTTMVFNIKEFLDVRKVRAALIEEEFVFLSRSGEYTKKLIIVALMNKYGVSKSYIELIVYAKGSKKTKRCILCNRPMTWCNHSNNKGVCNRCVVKEITNKEIIYDGQTESFGSNENTSGN